MNVYDFDHTIYDGDSTIDFFKYCLKRKPTLYFYVFVQIIGFLKYKLNIWNKHQFKQCFYCFLKYIDDPYNYVEGFWKLHKMKIKKWYLLQMDETDVIISASPEFLLSEICNELNIKHLIASKVDINSGKLLGENCYGEEKVKRFKSEFPNSMINKFYSDSFSDKPLADIARESYLVKKDMVKSHSFINEKQSLFLNGDFFKFVVIGVINTFNGVLFSSIAFIITNYPFLSFLFGYITSLLIAYLLNSFFIFKSKLNIFKLFKFCISYIPNFLIQTVVVSFLLVSTNIPEVIIYLLAAIVSVPITFLLVKFYAMK